LCCSYRALYVHARENLTMTALDPMGLRDKVALITGAGDGIGAAIAGLFARHGAAVAVADIDAAAAAAVVADIVADGGRAHAIAVDVCDGAAVTAMVDECIAALGGLDILVNNAGVTKAGTVVDVDEATWRRLFDINVNAGFLASKRALPHMIARRSGVILFVASVAAVRNTAGSVAYNASKSALVSMVRTMAGDHGLDGVRVNAILPGGVLTRMMHTTSKLLNKSFDEMAAGVPLQRRFAEPVEIANGALFLASDAASYITGHSLVIDGGVSVTSRPM
jgi:NAD(P)-dependent dehydrogenase (short-subunit alcohol dehydrogenase family)